MDGEAQRGRQPHRLPVDPEIQRAARVDLEPVHRPGLHAAGLLGRPGRGTDAANACGSGSATASTPSSPPSRRGRLAMLPGGDP
jgi:hypothetical protein